jgi:hypothetical protein
VTARAPRSEEWLASQLSSPLLRHHHQPWKHSLFCSSLNYYRIQCRSKVFGRNLNARGGRRWSIELARPGSNAVPYSSIMIGVSEGSSSLMLTC